MIDLGKPAYVSGRSLPSDKYLMYCLERILGKELRYYHALTREAVFLSLDIKGLTIECLRESVYD